MVTYDFIYSRDSFVLSGFHLYDTLKQTRKQTITFGMSVMQLYYSSSLITLGESTPVSLPFSHSLPVFRELLPKKITSF